MSKKLIKRGPARAWRAGGQSIAEYAILLAVVVGAFAATQVLLRRTFQARVKDAADALVSATNGSIGSVTVDGNTISAAMNNTSQYEPYYQEVAGTTYQETLERERMGKGNIIREKVSDIQARLGGSVQNQLVGNVRNNIKENLLWQ